MTVRVYQHDDASAPVWTGAIGGALAVLRGCLVTGYGAKPAAGWTEAFTGTNIAAFRAGGGNQRYLRVDDSATATARIVGYESMSDVNTGVGPTPTAGQISGGGYILKSSTADATARPWLVIATDKAFYLWVGFSMTTAQGIAGSTLAQPIIFFGDYPSYKSGDQFNTAIMCGIGATISSHHSCTAVTTVGSATSGIFSMRSYTQVGGSITIAKTYDSPKGQGSSIMGALGSTFPDPVTGGMMISPVHINENIALVTRGILPGFWAPLHNLPGSPGDVFQGSGALAGKEFLLLDGSSGATRARCAIEISDTW